jgi:starch-binding outer membrane protein SusE/F
MKKNFIIYLILIGLIGVFTGCKKDETRVVMLTSPVVPTITTLPDLVLQRTNSSDSVSFAGTPVDPGFKVSANYYIEACLHGDNFTNVVTIWSGIQDVAIKLKTSDLNGILLKLFPADSTSSADIRIRSVLVVDAGTGAPGSGGDPMTYISDITTVNINPYGFPRLDLINSGITQKIESPLGDGNYSGFVKLDPAYSFTLKDPESGTIYGTSGAALAVNGTAFSVVNPGWYQLLANTTGLTYALNPYNVGLVGSATPNGWNSPDNKMTYNPQTGTWDITITLVAGDIKFRLNDDWAWNLGGTPGNLIHNGANYTVTAGNYTISLTVTIPGPAGSEAGTFTITQNSR